MGRKRKLPDSVGTRLTKPCIEKIGRLHDLGYPIERIGEKEKRDRATVRKAIMLYKQGKHRLQDADGVALNRRRHFEELAEQAHKLVDSLEVARKQEKIKDVPFEDILMTDEDKEDYWNDLLERCLVDHIRDEVSELADVKKVVQLRAMDITNELLDKLSAIAHRKTFKGTCRICSVWVKES